MVKKYHSSRLHWRDYGTFRAVFTTKMCISVRQYEQTFGTFTAKSTTNRFGCVSGYRKQPSGVHARARSRPNDVNAQICAVIFRTVWKDLHSRTTVFRDGKRRGNSTRLPPPRVDRLNRRRRSASFRESVFLGFAIRRPVGRAYGFESRISITGRYRPRPSNRRTRRSVFLVGRIVRE